MLIDHRKKYYTCSKDLSGVIWQFKTHKKIFFYNKRVYTRNLIYTLKAWVDNRYSLILIQNKFILILVVIIIPLHQKIPRIICLTINII